MIKYDTVTELGWKVGATMHGIEKVIDNVLSLDWDVPSPVEEKDCIVRFLVFHFQFFLLMGNLWVGLL